MEMSHARGNEQRHIGVVIVPVGVDADRLLLIWKMMMMMMR